MSEQTVKYRSYPEEQYITSLEQKCDETKKQLERIIERLKAENTELRQALEGAAIIASIVAREIARLRSELESVKRGKEKP